MQHPSTILTKLEHLGLSKNQALVYFLLLERGECRVQELVSLTRIPRSSIYEILKALFGMGLATEIVEDTHKRIRPYPLSNLKHSLQEKIVDLENQTQELDELESILEVRLQNIVPPMSVRYYKDVSGARQLLWNTLKSQDKVYVYSAWGRGSYVGMKYYESFVAESRARGIQEQVLINPTDHALESIRKYTLPGSPISRTKVEDIRAIPQREIPITGETFIYGNVYAQIYLKDDEIVGFEIENSNFARMQRATFEKLWKLANPVSELL